MRPPLSRLADSDPSLYLQQAAAAPLTEIIQAPPLLLFIMRYQAHMVLSHACKHASCLQNMHCSTSNCGCVQMPNWHSQATGAEPPSTEDESNNAKNAGSQLQPAEMDECTNPSHAAGCPWHK